MNVAIGITTYKRPMKLANLLQALADQVPRTTPVIVADNDAARSAEVVVREHAHLLAVEYIWVERSGVVHGRNAILGAAAAAHTHLVFIDDDQEPSPDWYDQMSSGLRRFPNSVVAGYVENYSAQAVKDPYIATWLNRRKRSPNGSILSTAPTGNCGIPLAGVLGLNVPCFDARFNQIGGGEDADLFARLQDELGVRVLAWHDARVSEEVNVDRCQRPWIRRRLIREGLARATMEDVGLTRIATKGLMKCASGGWTWTLALAKRRGFSHYDEARFLAGVGYLLKTVNGARMNRFKEYGSDGL